MDHSEPTLAASCGNWVSGEEFWDRKEELALFLDYLRKATNLSLLAPRRTGKTSLLHEAQRLLGDDLLCLYLDLQKYYQAKEAVALLAAATLPHKGLWEKTKGLFGNALVTIGEHLDKVQVSELTLHLKDGLAKNDWQSKGDQLVDILAAAGRPVAIFMDEAPILLNRLLRPGGKEITPEGKREAETFLSWIRENSQRHKGQVCFVLAGSIGLEPIVQQAGLSAALNAFTPFELRPWPKGTAMECMGALARGYGLQLTSGAAEEMFRLLGSGVPYHVQLFMDRLHMQCHHSHTQEITPALARQVYRTEMLSVHGHAELWHLQERLKTVLVAGWYHLALDLLTETAVAGKLTEGAAQVLRARYNFKDSPDDVLRIVLEVLQHDGYLMPRGQNFVFATKYLRDWWKAHFAFGYVPVSKRKV